MELCESLKVGGCRSRGSREYNRKYWALPRATAFSYGLQAEPLRYSYGLEAESLRFLTFCLKTDIV